MSDEIAVYQPKFEVQSFEDDNLERVASTARIEPGSYWLFFEANYKAFIEQGESHDNDRDLSSLKDEDVLLLIDYAVDEHNVVHNVTLLLPPELQTRSGHANTIKLLINDLYRFFSPCDDGEERRKSQLDKVMAELSESQQKITDINKDPRRLMAELEAADDKEFVEARNRLGGLKALPSPNAGKDVSSPSVAVDAKQALEAKREIARTTALVLDKINQDLSGKAMTVGHYHSEIGHLAMARTKEARELVKRVEGAVASLDIYLGKDVDVVPVKRGAPGDPDEPFRLYQDMLYIDEESLINSDIGGADYGDVIDFLKMLEVDEALQERIFGFQRSIVTIRPRRRDKDYEGESPFESAQKNAANKFSFLLIRDGDNITAVHHPLGFLGKLFPSLTDMDKAFRRNGWADCRDITRDDIEFTQSLDKVEQIKRNYKRVVLMLQGIIDRDECAGEVFSGFPGGRPMLLNPADQARVFQFISLENAIIDDSRPRYHEWFKSLNRDLRVGSLVSVAGLRMTSQNAPGAYRFFNNGSDSYQDYDLADPSAFFDYPQVIEKHGEHIGFKRSFVKDGYGDGESIKNVIIRILSGNILDNEVISLEALRSDDIDYYLNSRRERESYASYIPQLLALKKLAVAEETRTKPVCDKVTAILKDSGKNVDPAKVFQAVMKYRADQKGCFDANLHEDNKAIELILNIYWQLDSGGEELIEKIITHFGDEQVVLVTSSAKNKIHVYTVNADNAETFDPTGFPWFSRYVLENHKTMRFSAAKPARGSDVRGKVTYLYRHDDYDALNLAQNKFHTISYIQYSNLCKKIDSVGIEGGGPINRTLRLIDELLAKDKISQKDFEDYLEHYEQFRTDLKYEYPTATMISIPIISVPVGIAGVSSGRDDGSSDPVKSKTVRLRVELFNLACWFIRKVDGLDRNGDWFASIKYKVKRLTNNHHGDVFSGLIDDRVVGIKFGLGKVSDSRSGLFSAFYGGDPSAESILQSERIYSGDIIVKDIVRLKGLSTFISQLPSIANHALSTPTFNEKRVNQATSMRYLIENFEGEIKP